jgi:hypothetical protein
MLSTSRPSPPRDHFEEIFMTIDRWIRFVAGSFVLLSLVLAHFVSPWFLLMTAFVGANLLQSSLTSFCPLTHVLRAAGVRDGVCSPNDTSRS